MLQHPSLPRFQRVHTDHSLLHIRVVDVMLSDEGVGTRSMIRSAALPRIFLGSVRFLEFAEVPAIYLTRMRSIVAREA
jgi:hypothetical protein